MSGDSSSALLSKLMKRISNDRYFVPNRKVNHPLSVGQQEVSFLVFANDDVAIGAMAFWKNGLPFIHVVSVKVHVPS